MILRASALFILLIVVLLNRFLPAKPLYLVVGVIQINFNLILVPILQIEEVCFIRDYLNFIQIISCVFAFLHITKFIDDLINIIHKQAILSLLEVIVS